MKDVFSRDAYLGNRRFIPAFTQRLRETSKTSVRMACTLF